MFSPNYRLMPTACAGAYLNLEIAKVDDPLKKARDV
jgi:hypothetical protein